MFYKKEKIPVLMYHGITKSGFNDSGCVYEIPQEVFEKQIKIILSKGYTPILLRDLLKNNYKGSRDIVITFDDGHISNYTIVFPLLIKFGIKAVFFITPDQIGLGDRINSEQLKEMVRGGMEIGSHGLTHAYLEDVSDTEAIHELKDSKNLLSNILNIDVVSFSAPGGRFRLKHIKYAKRCGYNFFCTSQVGWLKKYGHTFTVPRMAISKYNVDFFSLIIDCHFRYYFKILIRTKILKLLKLLLGNKNYDKLRVFIIKKLESRN